LLIWKLFCKSVIWKLKLHHGCFDWLIYFFSDVFSKRKHLLIVDC
jgi:hypothetical protein